MFYQKAIAIGSKRSSVRELFEYGAEKAKEIGAENIFDFSLGNPNIPSPAIVQETVKNLVDTVDPVELNGYTATPGDFGARKAVAESLNRRFGTNYSANNIFMTSGAAPALVDCVRACIVENGDEVITFAPFFTEYRVYVEAAGGNLTVIEPDIPSFQIRFDEFEKSINESTRAVIINTPNNPSGVIYSKETLTKLSEILTKKSEEIGHTIYLISDEPYREIVFDDVEVPWVPDYYKNTFVCYSYSKSLSLPGQRIGWILVPNDLDDRKNAWFAIMGSARLGGQVCASSLYQKVIEKCVDVKPDISVYQKNRDLLYDNLTEYGYECAKPEGTFYLFFKAPDGDSEAFSKKAREKGLLIPPGTGYGCPSYLRISFCVETERVEKSLHIFKELIEEYK